MVNFRLNGEVVSAESDTDTPLLWVLREELKLRGTKFGCGIAQCGAKQASRQASKQASMQASKQACKQASKQD